MVNFLQISWNIYASKTWGNLIRNCFGWKIAERLKIFLIPWVVIFAEYVVVVAYLRNLEVEERLISNKMKNKHKAATATASVLGLVSFILLVRRGLGCRQWLCQKRSDQFSAAIYIISTRTYVAWIQWRTTRAYMKLLWMLIKYVLREREVG